MSTTESNSLSPPHWFYAAGGMKIGPINQSEIVALLRDGTIRRDTVVWHDGMFDWKPACETELWENIVRGSPPPLPPSIVDNRLAWMIAAVPVMGAFVIRSVTESSSAPPSFYLIFAGYFATYSLLSLRDANQIEKSGHSLKNIRLAMWFWFVPVYLYKRAKVLGQSPNYLWCWIACFVLAIFIEQPSLLSHSFYWGVGVPACGSAYAKNQIKTLFKDIPAVRLVGIQGLDVIDAIQTDVKNGKLSCNAIVRASNGKDVPVSYTVESSNGQILIYVNLDVESSSNRSRSGNGRFAGKWVPAYPRQGPSMELFSNGTADFIMLGLRFAATYTVLDSKRVRLVVSGDQFVVTGFVTDDGDMLINVMGTNYLLSRQS